MAQIDVLLPVYNGERYLEASLRSIERQTFTDFRCLVLDDGSTDATAEICARFAERDARFEVIRKDNTGLVDTLNQGLERVEAPLVARCDADDVNVHRRFERQAAYLDENPLSIAVGGRQYVVDEHDRMLKISDRHRLDHVDPWSIPAQEPYLPHPFVMIRSDVLRDGGIRYRHFLHAEDADLYWRLSRSGVLYNLKDYVGYYRIHTQSVSAAPGNARIQMASAALAAIGQQRFLSDGGDLDVDAERALAMREHAGDFNALVELFAGELTPEEQRYLATASAVKFFQYASWRPYTPEATDLDFLATHGLRNTRLGGQALTAAVGCYLGSARQYGGFRLGHFRISGFWNLLRYAVTGMRSLVGRLGAAGK